MKKLLSTVLSLLLITHCIYSQTVITDLTDNPEAAEEAAEYIRDYVDNPLPVNLATREELSQLPFLTDKQIENIQCYIYKHGPIMSWGELLLIPGLERSTIELLASCISYQQPLKEYKPLSLKQIRTYAHRELTSRFDIPLYRRDGFVTGEYVGMPFGASIRYSSRLSRRYEAGLTAASTVGEPIFTHHNKQGFDYYSPYMILRDMGRLRTLALGSYRASYGYGLVMNSGFGLGKTLCGAVSGREGGGIRKHSSLSSSGRLCGAAASFSLGKRIVADVLTSFRMMDGKIENRLITSLKTGGQHRSRKEASWRNSFTNTLIGAHLSYRQKTYKLGITVVHNKFNRLLKSFDTGYRRYYPSGNRFTNAGIHYKFFLPQNITIWGEAAADFNFNPASVVFISYQPLSTVSLLLINRYYDYRYVSLYSRSFSEGGKVQNENGTYINLKINMLPKLLYEGYVDFFRFPYLRFRANKCGTTGWDVSNSLSYQQNYKLNFLFRYRVRRNQFTRGGQFYEKTRHRIKLRAAYRERDRMWGNVETGYVYDVESCGSRKDGWFVGGDFGRRSRHYWFDLSAAYFDVMPGASRMCMYERGPRYSFSMSQFYHRGVHAAVNFCIEPVNNFRLHLKYTLTEYMDVKSIGSGADRIGSCRKNDVILQLSCKF